MNPSIVYLKAVAKDFHFKYLRHDKPWWKLFVHLWFSHCTFSSVWLLSKCFHVKKSLNITILYLGSFRKRRDNHFQGGGVHFYWYSIVIFMELFCWKISQEGWEGYGWSVTEFTEAPLSCLFIECFTISDAHLKKSSWFQIASLFLNLHKRPERLIKTIQNDNRLDAISFIQTRLKYPKKHCSHV